MPQDPISIELGAKFKESQLVVRDARKVLAKRKAEFDERGGDFRYRVDGHDLPAAVSDDVPRFAIAVVP